MTTHILCAFLAMFDETFVTDMGFSDPEEGSGNQGWTPCGPRSKVKMPLWVFRSGRREWEQGLTPCGPRSSVKTWGFPIRKKGLGTGVDPVRAQKQSENARGFPIRKEGVGTRG